MALTLSDEMMKHMGFRTLAAGEVLKARFSQLAVFSIEGITVASAETVAIAVKNHACKLAIAQKINEACQALLPNGYTADEWSGRRNISAAAHMHSFSSVTRKCTQSRLVRSIRQRTEASLHTIASALPRLF